ncbi:MAG: CoA pyrophosphatase [Proteobacteria bacterium]|nr:MAG: CoA pyrophosphatase [Pseudomonadota bacterium]
MLTIDEIRTTLRQRPHEPAAFQPQPAHAAVAMILAEGDNDLDVCFIQRAERDGDPWSGQVAFPGGRADPVDRDASAVAERETFEEIGLKLHAKHLIGPLPVRPIERQEINVLSPFVYYVPGSARGSARVCERLEVASVFWVPLQHLFNDEAATELEHPLGGKVQRFPGIQFGDHVIWGLTLRILESFADIMQRSLAARN